MSHLGKSYGSRRAVRDVTFELGHGITGLLGPNGAGKSTLMRCLTGLVGWDTGEVRIEGIDPTWQPSVRRRIGFMPERVAFPAEMRLLDYLRFVSEMKGIPRSLRVDAVETALHRAGLTQARGRIIGNLSKGYRQRVGLAQAVLGNPAVALLDEPTAGLDPLNVLETRDVLREYARGRAVLVSTHVLPEARLLCDRVIVMSRGSIVYRGPVSELASAGHRRIPIRIRVRPGKASTQGGPPAIDACGANLVQCLDEGGQYVLLVDARDEAAIGDLVTRLAVTGWSVLAVEPTTDALEEAFREAVQDDVREVSP